MNILHYTFGLAPARRGGSVQYAYDLMRQQSRGNNVYALVCGDTLFRGDVCKVKKSGKDGDVKVYSLSNPLTPTLIYGVSSPAEQHRNVRIDYDNIRNFIVDNEIAVMHIHTLMGLHKDIVKFIKSLGVKIVYTTHDFHGICPHYNLINQNGDLCNEANGKVCALCNLHEPSDRFLRIANSHLYHLIKKSGIFKILSKPKAKTNAKTEDKSCDYSSDIISDEQIIEYDALLNYYREYFNLVDIFHFNSSQTKDVFQHFIPSARGYVIPVITSGIRDKRKNLTLKDTIVFGFIGSTNEYKGFSILKTVMKELYDNGHHNFKLRVYAGTTESIDPECPNIEYRPPYNYSEVSDVFYNLDCVVVPSKWYETFSLVTLEALGHGRPVIVSDHVGAKDVVRDYKEEYIFSSPDDLKNIITDILNFPKGLQYFNDLILSKEWPFSIEKHSDDIIRMYGQN